jgi:TRAP-type C4-dicarboxylate transport system permease small subunit
LYQALSRAIDAISETIAYISGAGFALLSIYITYDSIARSLDLPFTGVSDEISGYCLAVGGTWGMAYALQIGAHVRIDLIIAHLGVWLRRVLDVLAGAATMCFAALLAFYAWGQAHEAFTLGTKSITVLQAPLVIPQGLVAIGYSLLAVQAAAMLLRGTVAPIAVERI